MIIPYTVMPFGAPPRPLVDVIVGTADFEVKGLADSGAVNTFFGSWVADEAGLDLSNVPARPLAVGASMVGAKFVNVTLSAAGHTWEAEVGFADSWDKPFGLLGHSSFFRQFSVTFRAADLEFEVDPITE